MCGNDAFVQRLHAEGKKSACSQVYYCCDDLTVSSVVPWTVCLPCFIIAGLKKYSHYYYYEILVAVSSLCKDRPVFQKIQI